MKLLCAHCGNASFSISTDKYDRAFATCQKCEQVMPFETRQAANPQMEPDEDRVLYFK